MPSTTGAIVVELGKKVASSSSEEITVGDDFVRGPHWSASKIDDRCIFEYMSGELAGSTKQQEISQEDFRRLRRGEMSELDLMLAYDLH